MAGLLLSILLATSVADRLEGAEIGDANQYVSFQSGGRYRAQQEKPKSIAKGKWKVVGDTVTVTVTSCSGPGCAGPLGKGFVARIENPAETAMLVRATPADAPLSTGAYFCMSQGCEKRIGLELAVRPQRAPGGEKLAAQLQENDELKDTASVWSRPSADPESRGVKVWICPAGGERAKDFATTVRRALQSTMRGVLVTPLRAQGDCAFDVRLELGPEVPLPEGGR